MEVGARMIPSSAYRKLSNKVDDFVEVLGVEKPKNKADDFVEVLGVEKPKKWNRTPDKKFNAVEDNHR
jgi:hypothetical protein